MSERSLVYRVALAGQAEFARDLSGLLGRVKRAATEQVAIDTATERQRRRARDDTAKHASALLRTNLALEKARARESVREAERAEKAKTKTATAEEKARARAAQNEQKASIRAKLDEQRAFERSEREKTRIAQRELRARAREEESVRRATMRAEEASSRHIFRQRQEMMQRLDREAARHERDRMFDRKRLARGIGTGIAGGAGGAAHATFNAASRGVRSIASGMGANSALDVTDIVAERMEVERMLRSVAIEARTAGSGFGGFDERGAATSIRTTALRYGIKQRDLANAVDVYSEKGSGKTAVENMDRIAMQATAMGTDVATISKLRAQMGLSSDVTGKELSEDEKDELIAKMHFLGKTGVFRAEDMAIESESLFSQFAKSGGDFRKGFDRYLSFANEARKSHGSGATARTSINAVQDQIAKKEDKIGALGIRTRDEDGTQRDFIDVALDVIQKTGGKGKAFNTIFDPAKSGKALSTLVTQFQTAGGGDVGRTAMEDLLKGDSSMKMATVAEMQKDADARLDTPSASIARSVEVVRQAFSDKLAPVLEKLAENAPKIAAGIAKALDFIVEHPALTAGAVLGGGALKGGTVPLLGAGLRFGGDLIAGKGGKFVGAVGGALSSASATPVYVTGAAPGVFGGGGGGGGVPGGVPGGLVGVLSGPIVGTVAGVAGLTVAAAALSGALWDLYKTTDTYKKSFDETVEKHLREKADLRKARENKVTTDRIFDENFAPPPMSVGYAFQPGSKLHGDKKGGKGRVVQTREEASPTSANNVMLGILDEALGVDGLNKVKAKGFLKPNDIQKGLGIQPTGGPTLIEPGAEAMKILNGANSPVAADGDKHMTQFVKTLSEATKTLDDFNAKAKTAGGNVSAFKLPTRGG